MRGVSGMLLPLQLLTYCTIPATPRSDVLRLLVLERYGGVYIDHDALVLRSFKPLYHNHFVMMREGVVVQPHHAPRVVHDNLPTGKYAYYNNGIMISSPYSRFVMRLAAQYSSYNGTSWCGAGGALTCLPHNIHAQDPKQCGGWDPLGPGVPTGRVCAAPKQCILATLGSR